MRTQSVYSNLIVKRWVLFAGRLAFIAVVYFLAARYNLLLAYENTNSCPVWLPSGIAVALLFILGPVYWPGVFLGAFAANYVGFQLNQTAPFEAILAVSGFIGAGNSVEAVLGSVLLRQFISPEDVYWPAKNVFKFFVSALLMCLSGSVIGAASLTASGIADWQDLGTVWLTWWLGDIGGILVVVPLLISWYGAPGNQFKARYVLELLVYFALFYFCSWVVFGDWGGIFVYFKHPYVLLPFLLWIVFRFDQKETALAVAFVSAIAVIGTIQGHGPFVYNSLNESLLVTQGFIVMVALAMLSLSAIIHERKEAEMDLQNSNRTLEDRVARRTEEILEQNKKLLNVTEDLKKQRIAVLNIAEDAQEALDKLQEKSEELARSNRELESFAYVASHDLQEPLRMIASYSQLLQKRYTDKLDAKANEYINFAVDGAVRMQLLINDLLLYSRVGTRGAPFEPTDCQQVYKTAVSNLMVRIDEQSTVIKASIFPVVMGDAIQLTQLFQNLIENAIKYCRQKPRIDILVEDTGTDWLFIFKDNGIGIDEKYSNRIFQIFQRLHTKEEFSGTGIGLAICKKIVERHGGTIWVESKPGEGAAFKFTLPKREGTA